MSAVGHSDEFGVKHLGRSCLSEEVPGGSLFTLELWYELKESQGEDAIPILDVDGGLLTVFDGMGGAGGASYEDRQRLRTGASIGSELARNCVREYFAERSFAYSELSSSLANRLAKELAEVLHARFVAKAAELRTGAGRLEGKLLRTLPTTMACIYYRLSPGRDSVYYLVFWAGDSRAYRLTPGSGMQQLTADEIKSGGDALQNLRDDSLVSNCISADSDFHILYRAQECLLPVTLFVATDGCFNYLPTPFHFEHEVVASLMESSTVQQWKPALNSRLQSIAADDFSMAVVGLGWSHFERMKASYEGRNRELVEKYIEPLNRLDDEIRYLHGQHKLKIEERESLRRQLWKEYKANYEAELLSRPDMEGRSEGG